MVEEAGNVSGTEKGKERGVMFRLKKRKVGLS